MNTQVLRKIVYSIIIPLFAAAIQWPVYDHLRPSLWVVFYPAVFISVMINGRWGAIISPLLSALLSIYLFADPRFSFPKINPNVFVSGSIFVCMGLLFGVFEKQLTQGREKLTRSLKKLADSENQLRSMNIELEKRVDERTRELQDSEERFRLILENMEEGAQIIDYDWNYVFLNASIENHSQRPNSELIGKNFLESWPGIETSHLYHVIEKCMKDRISCEIENEFIYPDHSTRWFELSIQPVKEGVFILSYDITARKNVEKSLKLNNRLYSTISQINQMIIRTTNRQELFENAIQIVQKFGEFPLAWIGIYDSIKGEIAVASQSHPLPFKNQKIKKKDIAEDTVGKAFISQRTCTVNNLQNNPGMKHWKNLAKELGFNSAASVPLTFQDEVYASLNLYAEGPDAFESESEIRLIEEIGMDISFALDSLEKEEQRVEAEKQLVASEERYRTVANYTYDWEFWIDPDGRFVYMSPSCERITGYSPSEFLTKPGLIFEIIHPDDVDIWIKHNINYESHSDLEYVEFRIIRKDGEVRWISHACRAINRPDGTYLGRRASNRDVTEKKNAEDNLSTREKVLQLFVENSPAAIAMFDTNMNYMVASQRFLSDYRLPEDQQIIGKSHYEVFPEISESWKALHKRCLAGETLNALQDPFPRMDGSLDWVRWEIKPWYREDNSIGGIILFSEVITDQVKMNEVLQKDEEQMKALVNSLDDIVFECDYSGKYLNIWASDEKLLFKSKEDLLGKTILDVMGEDEGRKFIDAITHVQKDMHSIILEYDLKVADGRKWFTARINPIFDKNRESRSVVFLVRDISDRKKAELEREQSERTLRQIIDLVPHFIFAKDLNGKYIIANRALAEAYGTTPEILTGRTDADFSKAENEVRYFREKDLEVINSSKLLVIPEEEFSDSNGLTRFLQTTKIPFDVMGNNLGVLGVSVDISEQKQAEKKIQLQLNRMRTLNEIGQAIASSLNVQISLNFLLDEVLAQLNADAAAVLLYNEVDRTLEFSSGKGFRTDIITKSKVALGESLAGKAGKERKTLLISNLGNESLRIVRKSLFQDENFVEYIGIPLVAKGSLKGVLEIFNRVPHNPDKEWMDYLETLGNQAALAIDNSQLFEDMQISHEELITAYDATITGWSNALDLRDKETEGHAQRVTKLTLYLAKALNISREEQIHYRRGALLHDIGKIGVPDAILLKPGKLSDDEWATMKKHPEYAFQLLSPIGYLKNAIEIPYCHHEKWDGSGYPRGLVGEQIPVSARIFAVVDVWDALSSDRPYRPKWKEDDIFSYLHEQKGKHFEPRIVDLFLQMIVEDKLNGSLNP